MNNFVEKMIIPAIVSLFCTCITIYYHTPNQLRKVNYNSLIDQLEREFDNILKLIVKIRSEQDFNNELSSFLLLQSNILFIQKKIVQIYPKTKINYETIKKLRQLLTSKYSNEIKQIQAEVILLKNKTILGFKKKY